MQKTPVSILQEMMVKKQTVPDYVLIHNGGGSHINTFTYQVSCEGLSARGTGRSKKDAKHEAAKAMLETIAAHRGYPQLPASPAQSPVKTPEPAPEPASSRTGPNVPFVNAIGELQILCIENNLEEPKYIAISDEGPPHARIFTYQCILSTFKEQGVATTKKQAKHEAAKKMWNRLKSLVDDETLPDDKIIERQVKMNAELTEEIVKQRYIEIKKVTTKRTNLGLRIADYHVKLKQFFEVEENKECIEFLQSISSDGKVEHIEERMISILNNFKNILEKLDLELTRACIPTFNRHIQCVLLRINCSPVIVQSGLGKTEYEATCQAFMKLLNTIMEFVN